MEPVPHADPAVQQQRLADLEREWDARFAQQPKLPSSALLSGAVAMACGFGAVMFFAFAWLRGFQLSYCIWCGIFATLSVALGLFNRMMARRWLRSVEAWSAERKELNAEIAELRSKLAGTAAVNPERP